MLSPIFSVTPGARPHQISMQYLIHLPSEKSVALHLKTIKSTLKKVDHNTQKMMTYNETFLTVEITDITTYKGLSFKIAHKPRFKKVLDLEITVSKRYQPPNMNLIYRDILDVIHDQNMERNLSLIKKV